MKVLSFSVKLDIFKIRVMRKQIVQASCDLFFAFGGPIFGLLPTTPTRKVMCSR